MSPSNKVLGDVLGVVLAGGMGRRLGRDKTSLSLPGQNADLLNRTAALLLSLGLEARIACAADQAERAARCGLELIPDLYPGQGAMAGIYSALQQSRRPCLIIACDMPFLRGEELEDLLQARQKAPQGNLLTAWKGWDGRKPESLAAIYEGQALPYFEKSLQAGQRALHRLLPPESCSYLEYGPERAKYFLNINHPEDLEEALRRLSE